MIKNSFRRLPVNPLLLAFLSGTALILLIRLVFTGNSGAIIAVLIASFIIFLLGLYYYKSSDKDPGRAGDDLYYLGLLFTLVSLSYALVSLFILSPEGDLERRTYDLIGGFGIALASTVVGILARILLQDIETRSVGGDPGLNDSGDLLALRRQLREATDAFSHFTRMTLNQAEQTAVHSDRLIKEFNERMSAGSRHGLEEVATSWREVVQKMEAQSEQAIDRSEKNWLTLAERLEATFGTLATHLEATAARINALGETAANVTTGLDEHAAEIVKTQEALVRGAQQWRHELETSVKAMSDMPGHINSANNAFNTFSGQLEVTGRRVNSLGETVTNSITRLDERAAEIIKAYEALAQDLQQQQKDGLQIHKNTISSFSDLLGAESGQLQGKLIAFRNSVEEFVAVARKQQEVVQQNAEEAERLNKLILDWVSPSEREPASPSRWFWRRKN